MIATEDVIFKLNVLWGLTRGLEKTASGHTLPPGLPTSNRLFVFYRDEAGCVWCSVSDLWLYLETQPGAPGVRVHQLTSGRTMKSGRMGVLEALWKTPDLSFIGHDGVVDHVVRAIFFGRERTHHQGDLDSLCSVQEMFVNKTNRHTGNPEAHGNGDFSAFDHLEYLREQFGCGPASRRLSHGRW